MSLTLLVYCCFFTPIVADPPAESVAVVDLRECFQHAPTSDSDRGALQKSVEETDAEARKLVEALEESEYYANLGNSTNLQKTKARILKLEFEAFRHREQDRLRKAEQDMYKKWHKQVDIAVKTVAQRDGFTIVLYIGKDENPEVAETEPLLVLTRTHVGFALDLDRTNITDKVVAEMSTEAFEDSIETEDEKSE
jgi:Skp family chaperone for outer membrane proteins